MKQIWDFLKEQGFSDCGAAGIMGNIDVESGLKSNNLQDTYQNKLGYTDETYTKAVDNGTYTNFVNDSAGYGLCQWTWWPRKQKLLQLAKSKNKSISDIEIQLDLLIQELKLMPNLYNLLKNAKSVKEASDAFMIQFENPYDKSENAKSRRANYGMTYYNKYAKGEKKNMGTNNYMKYSNTRLSKYFTSNEFDCHGSGCCNQTKINSQLVVFLDKIREHFNKPITITSGYRCETHNRRVGGATGSRHSRGDAADIVVKDIPPAQVAAYAQSIGVKGIGLYETAADGHFTHIDTRDYQSFWYGQKEQPRTSFIITTQQAEVEAMLLFGSVGEEVKKLQIQLNNLGYSTNGIDGIFGKGTLSAVKQFQRDHDLDDDGFVGPATKDALKTAQKTKTGERTVKVVANLLNVRSNPNTNSRIIARVPNGTQLTIIEENSGWLLLKTGGWVCAQYTTEVM